MSAKSVASLAKKPKTAASMNPLDKAQVASAVKALLAHHKALGKESLDLEASQVTLQLGLKRCPAEEPSPKPRAVPLPHALRTETTACLFVKDADKPWVKALVTEGEQPGSLLKDPVKLDGTRAAKMAKRSTPMRAEGTASGSSTKLVISKVISLAKLRTSYAQFKARRELRDSYDVFFADERIVPMLGKALGSTFFSRKKQPIAVKVTRPESLQAQIAKSLKSAQVVLRTGTCVSAAVAQTDMKEQDVVDNVYMGCDALIRAHIPRKWRNVQSVSLKLPHSVALPIYSALPEASSDEALAKAAEQADAKAKAKLLAKVEREEDEEAWPLIALDEGDEDDEPAARAADEQPQKKRLKKSTTEKKQPKAVAAPEKTVVVEKKTNKKKKREEATPEPDAPPPKKSAEKKKKAPTPKKAASSKAASPKAATVLETKSESAAKPAAKKATPAKKSPISKRPSTPTSDGAPKSKKTKKSPASK